MINYVCALKIDKSILVLIKGLIFLLPMTIYGWEPPIGIPRPEFGIDETHEMYKGKMFSFSTGAKKYPETANGPYTHYIDNTHPDATDSNNPYGSTDKPRLTIPKEVLEGAIVEIHGGPYTVNYSIWKMSGSQNKPIFIRGIPEDSKPLLKNGILYISGSYIVFESIKLRNVPIGIRTFTGNDATHHVALRYCESDSLDATAILPCSDDTSKPTNNVVIFNNKIHSDLFDPQNPPVAEDDDCGVYIGKGSSHVWVLENDIYRFKGDAVGGGHGANYSAKNYYIGKNDLHDCFENAIDIKEAKNIIVSENILRNMNPGIAVVHYGPKYSPENVWFIANAFKNSKECGLQVGGDQKFDVYVIGNVFDSIHNDINTATGYRTWSSRGVFFLNNVFKKVDIPVKSNVEGDSSYLVLQNCILNSDSIFLDVSGSSHMKKSVISNNIFRKSTNNCFVKWGGQVQTIKCYSDNATIISWAWPDTAGKSNNRLISNNTVLLRQCGVSIEVNVLDSLCKIFPGTNILDTLQKSGIYDMTCFNCDQIRNNKASIKPTRIHLKQ